MSHCRHLNHMVDNEIHCAVVFALIDNVLYIQFAYNNSLPGFMRLPWRNSASGMFVNLNISSFDEMLRIFMSRVSVSNYLHNSIYNSPCCVC